MLKPKSALQSIQQLYSYLYNLTGLREKQGDLYSEGEDAKKTIDETLDGVVSVFNSVEGISDTATGITIDNIGDSFEGIQGNILVNYGKRNF